MKDYLHEIPKETLTLKNIKCDLKAIYKGYLTAFFVLFPFALIWVKVTQWICEDKIYDKLGYVFWLMPATFFALSVTFLIEYIKGVRGLNKKINIVSDWLIDITEYTPTRRYSRPYYSFAFAKYGTYQLYMGGYEKNYNWSKMYSMSNEGIYNYSHTDDDFYLVLSGGKKPHILLIYNKKLFELKENII